MSKKQKQKNNLCYTEKLYINKMLSVPFCFGELLSCTTETQWLFQNKLLVLV